MKRTKQEKSFGIQIDSLSDLFCFGALPALIVFSINRTSYWYALLSAIYMLCALIRLAWFNVDEEERQSKEDGARKTYLGLPVTTSAIGIPLFIGVGSLTNLPLNHVYPWLMMGIGIAFLTPFRMKKPHLVGKLILITIGLGLIPLVLIGVPA